MAELVCKMSLVIGRYVRQTSSGESVGDKEDLGEMHMRIDDFLHGSFAQFRFHPCQEYGFLRSDEYNRNFGIFLAPFRCMRPHFLYICDRVHEHHSCGDLLVLHEPGYVLLWIHTLRILYVYMFESFVIGRGIENFYFVEVIGLRELSAFRRGRHIVDMYRFFLFGQCSDVFRLYGLVRFVDDEYEFFVFFCSSSLIHKMRVSIFVVHEQNNVFVLFAVFVSRVYHRHSVCESLFFESGKILLEN